MEPEYFPSQLPLWVVACLGKPVMLTREFAGPCEIYSKGCEGILCGIECYPWNNGGVPYAIVALDPNDPSYVENFPFDHLQPAADRVKYSLDVQQGVIAF